MIIIVAIMSPRLCGYHLSGRNPHKTQVHIFFTTLMHVRTLGSRKTHTRSFSQVKENESEPQEVESVSYPIITIIGVVAQLVLWLATPGKK